MPGIGTFRPRGFGYATRLRQNEHEQRQQVPIRPSRALRVPRQCSQAFSALSS